MNTGSQRSAAEQTGQHGDLLPTVPFVFFWLRARNYPVDVRVSTFGALGLCLSLRLLLHKTLRLELALLEPRTFFLAFEY